MLTVRTDAAVALLPFLPWLAFGTLVSASNDDLAHAQELYFLEAEAAPSRVLVRR